MLKIGRPGRGGGGVVNLDNSGLRAGTDLHYFTSEKFPW